MKICGIIAEYDPLHNGHVWQLREARRLSNADFVICAMSGSFTQRGVPALLSAHVRAEMALRAGADLVLGLPVSFSVCDAMRFAMGGVFVLCRAGADCLCFGVEPESLPFIDAAASLLERPTEAFQRALRQRLDAGFPFPRAQGEALAETLDIDNSLLNQPNMTLAICYARANMRLHAGLRLLPVPRSGAYRSETLPVGNVLPSATAVRKAVLAGQWEAVASAMPPDAYALLRNAVNTHAYHPPEALTPLLRWTLRETDDFSCLPDLSEGIENRLRAAADCLCRADMVEAVRAKRYPYARVSRLLTHALFRTDSRRLPGLPEHAWVLGFRKGASAVLRNADFPFISVMPPRQISYDMRLDAISDDLWQLGASLPFGAIYREKPLIL